MLPEPCPAECRYRSQENCQCGLVPFRLTNNLGTLELHLEVEEVFDNLLALHFRGYASGGPHTAGPRKGKIAFALTAVHLAAIANEWKISAQLTDNLVGKAQTVPRGQAYALLFYLRAM